MGAGGDSTRATACMDLHAWTCRCSSAGLRTGIQRGATCSTTAGQQQALELERPSSANRGVHHCIVSPSSKQARSTCHPTLSLMSILDGSEITSSILSASLLCRTFFSSSMMPGRTEQAGRQGGGGQATLGVASSGPVAALPRTAAHKHASVQSFPGSQHHEPTLTAGSTACDGRSRQVSCAASQPALTAQASTHLPAVAP